jgi:hypothetical protein
MERKDCGFCMLLHASALPSKPNVGIHFDALFRRAMLLWGLANLKTTSLEGLQMIHRLWISLVRSTSRPQ